MSSATATRDSQAERLREIEAFPIPEGFTRSASPEYVASAKMPFEDFLRFEPCRGMAEWVDGEVFIYMSVEFVHHRVVNFLNAYFTFVMTYLKLGLVGAEPYALRSPSGRAGREPDLFLVSRERQHLMGRQYFDGAPDLVVEVISDDSVRRDADVKRREYEEAGVREYWVIDPRPGKEGVTFFVLAEGRYGERVPGTDGAYVSSVFPAIKLRPEWLFAEEPPLEEAIGLALGGPFAMRSGPRL